MAISSVITFSFSNSIMYWGENYIPLNETEVFL